MGQSEENILFALFFYKQLVYKQLALEWKIAKQLPPFPKEQ